MARSPHVREIPSWARRERPLICLRDHSTSRRLTADLFGVEGRDRSWNLHAFSFIGANQAHLDAIDVDAVFVSSPDQIDLKLKPGGSIGAVPLRSPTTQKIAAGLVVQPRFGWNGIGLMLHRVGWSASPQLLTLPLVPGSAKEVPPWVLAGPILHRFRQLLDEITRGFRMHDEVRQNPRGQILWQRYLNEQIVKGDYHQLPCRFPELGPDLQLRGFLRWGTERIRISLADHTGDDIFASRLAGEAAQLLHELRDAKPVAPAKSTLARFLHSVGVSSATLVRGLEALGWIADERGLGGAAVTDGLSWAMPMHALFERWVEQLVRTWAHGFGGTVRTGRTHETLVPVHWNRAGGRSLSSLIPDLVVQVGRRAWILDAKYKGHLEEVDDQHWAALADEMQAEHRHDLHQVLAYASTVDADHITTVLVYPLRRGTWERQSQQGLSVLRADIPGSGRHVDIALVGLPVELGAESDLEVITRTLGQLLRWSGCAM